MTFSDNIAVKASTIDSSDVQVVNTVNGYSQIAKLISIDHTTNGTPRVATYQVTAPGGMWDTPDNGSYSIKLRASQVSDVAGNFAAATTLGTLHVSLPGTITLSGRAFVDHNGDGVVETYIGSLFGEFNVLSVNLSAPTGQSLCLKHNTYDRLPDFDVVELGAGFPG